MIGLYSMMENKEVLKRARAAARGWLTRSIKSLSDTLEDMRDKYDIETGLEDLNKRISGLEEAQGQYEISCEEDDIEQAIEEVASEINKALVLRSQANRTLAQYEAEDDRSSVSSAGRAGQTVKLPKLELAHFSGDLTQWTSWWDNFKAAIDDSDLADVVKFTYLQSLLEGEAASVVKGLTLTSKHYKVACELLAERYGRPEAIIFHHIQNLMTLEGHGRSSLVKLRNLQDQVLINVRSLEALGVDGSTYGMFLTPLILSRLPSDIRMEWARVGKGKEGDLDFLLDFMKEELQHRDRADAFNVQSEVEMSGPRVPTDSALLSTALHQCQSQECGICQEKHQTEDCQTLLKMEVPDRVKTVCYAGLCFRCLLPGHTKVQCKSLVRCSICSGLHSRILCWRLHNGLSDNQSVGQVGNTLTHASVLKTQESIKRNQVIMQLVKVEVNGPNGKIVANVMLDSGSDKTYVTKSLTRKLGLERVQAVQHRYSVFGGIGSSMCQRNVFNFDLNCTDLTHFPISALEVPKICAPLYQPKLPREILDHVRGFSLVACDPGEVEIDMLVGLDYYWNLVGDVVLRVPGHNLVVQKTLAGYVLSGEIQNPALRNMTSHQLFCHSYETSGVRPGLRSRTYW